jgi:uncharacterized repeat protein (TIGR01451 family)
VIAVGGGFASGATLKLSCQNQSDVLATNVFIAAAGRTLTGTFNLTGLTPGACSVSIANPDGAIVSLSSGFAVQQGGGPKFRISKIGTTPSPGQAASYAISVTNAGNIDATNVNITEFLDPEFALTSIAPSAILDVGTLSSKGVIPWPVTQVAAGRTKLFLYNAKLDLSVPSHSFVLGGPACVNPDYLAIAQCGLGLVGFCGGAAASCSTLPEECAAAPPLCPLFVGECFELLRKCQDIGPVAVQCIVSSANSLGCASTMQEVRSPGDPNYLIGPAGIGVQQWVSAVQPFQYIVAFGNEASATAPAQQVIRWIRVWT